MLLLGHDGSWPLRKHWLLPSNNHHPIISAKSCKGDQVENSVWLWEGHVDSFTHCTYMSCIFLSLSITSQLLFLRHLCLLWEKYLTISRKSLPATLPAGHSSCLYHHQIISAVISMGEGMRIHSLTTALNSNSLNNDLQSLQTLIQITFAMLVP